MNTSEIHIVASNQAALEEICRALEAQYGDRVQLERAPTPYGEWYAQGTLTTVPTVPAIPSGRKHRHQRIILA